MQLFEFCIYVHYEFDRAEATFDSFELAVAYATSFLNDCVQQYGWSANTSNDSFRFIKNNFYKDDVWSARGPFDRTYIHGAYIRAIELNPEYVTLAEKEAQKAAQLDEEAKKIAEDLQSDVPANRPFANLLKLLQNKA